MKRITFFAALVFLFALPGFATHVRPDVAQKAAKTFMNSLGAASAELTDITAEAGFPNLYVFTNESNFVVMAADDRVQPILGYSLGGGFVTEQIPDNVREWLQGYSDQIQYVRDNFGTASEEVARQWQELVNETQAPGQTRTLVGPLIATSWDQTYPYNYYCPSASGGSGNHVYTGCVATAMAQVIKYHNAPVHGIGSHSYNHATYGEQSANFGETNYAWNNMPTQIYTNSPQTQINAVATLMYHCGVSVDMNYGTSGSGASSEKVAPALKNYFNFSQSTTYVDRNSYSDNDWIALMRSELNASRPVIYNGSSTTGHSFVCDGYDSGTYGSYYFHFNWGWSGSYDGYFSIDNMTPGGNGAGGGSHNYSYNQDAIIGIQPSTNTAIPTNLTYTMDGANVTLNWTAASGASSYNIYCNNNYVGNSTTNSYTGAAPFGTNVYYVRSVDANGELSLSSNTVSVTVGFQTPVVDDLSATISGHNVNLTWSAPDWCYPESPTAMVSYGDGDTYYSWTSVYYAHKYLAADLAQYANKSVYKVSTYVQYPGTYSAYVYVGSTSSGQPNSSGLAMSKLGVEVTSIGWFDFVSDEPIILSGTDDLWVVMKQENTGQQYPTPSFNTTSHNTNAFYAGNSPTYLYDANSNYNCAWRINASITDGVYTYNLYRNGARIGNNLNNTSYTDNNLADGSYTYYVKTNYYGGESPASNQVTAEIGAVSNYTITATANPTEGGTVSGGGTYQQGQTCTLTATPNTGYSFISWTKNGQQVSTNSTYSFNVTETATYVANFEMITYQITATANPTEGGAVVFGIEGQKLFFEPFEEYTVGNKVASEAISAGHGWWTTWSNAPGSSEDGVVAEYNGNQCAHLTYGNDQVLLFGDEQNGIYDLDFDVLVPYGKNGYFNILHNFAGSGSTWAMQCYLHMTNDGQNSIQAPGHGTIHAGSNNTADVPCVYDAWMHFRLHVDTDNDIAQYYYTAPGEDEVLICEWQWSLDSFGENTVGRTLAAMDFYPSSNAATSEFYLDNFSLKKTNGDTAPALSITPETIQVNLAEDEMTSLPITITNEGNSIGEWMGWLDFGQGGTGTQTNELYYYNGEDNICIGSSSACTREIGIRLPASVYAGFAMGTRIASAQYFVRADYQSADHNYIFRIYGQDQNNQPGELLAEKTVYTTESDTWITATFDEAVYMTGQNIWATVQIAQNANEYPFAMDTGNYGATADGNWISTNGGVFSHCYSEGNFSGAWMLKVNCIGTPIYATWASVDKNDGSLLGGQSETVTLTLNSIGGSQGTYNTNFVINTNDANLSHVEMPITLNISNRNGDSHTVSVANGRGTTRATGVFANGSTCIVRAVANEGYAFANWTKNGEVVFTGSTYSFTVTEDATIVANFEEVDNDPLTYAINPDGVSVTVTGHVDGTAATGGITIPEAKTINGVTYTVTAIEAAAFQGCNGLTGDLVIPNTVTTIGFAAFNNCSGFTGSLIIPNSVTSIGGAAFAGCSGFNGTLTISNSVTEIGTQVFQYCSGFTGSLDIPNSVTSIGQGAFYNCRNFTSLILPNSLTSIGNSAFHHCDGFTGILDIPSSMTEIGYQVFEYCWGFTGLTLPNTLTNIETYAFYDCAGFTGDLILPASLASIGGHAFDGCGFTAIQSLAVMPPTLGEGAFANVDHSIPVTVPCGSLNDYMNIPDWSAFVNMQADCNSYTITVTVAPVTGGSVEGAGIYAENSVCTLTATPTQGFHFVNWTRNSEVVSTDLTYSFTVTEDAEFVANFELNAYEITVLAVPAEGGTVTGAGIYNHYSPCFVTATPNPGYHFVNWTLDGTVVTTNQTYGFDVYGPVNLVAYFELDTYEITATASPASGGVVTGGGTYGQGATCILTATPNENYTFIHWTKNGQQVSTDPIYSFTVTESAAFVAKFRNNQGEITQSTNLTTGWNWWSTYIESDDLFGQLKTGLGDNATQIKSSTSFVNYFNGMWIGGLNNISNESCYLIKANNACTLEMTGNQATPANHPITINPNWNWIGYPNTGETTVANAFSNITPTNGDQVKSQNAFSTYYSGMWVGGLTTITPGMGLLYKSNSTGAMTLIYPEPNRSEELVENVTNEDNHWTADYHAYPSNMTVTAVIELDDVELQGENYELAAFANGECRGSARLMYVEQLNRYIAFLTVVGDEASELRFSLYNDETGTAETQSIASLQYETNAIVGSLETPYVIRFRSTTGMDEWSNSINIFPNPVSRGEQFSLGLPIVETRRATSLQIVNAMGVVVETLRATSVPAHITAPKVAGVYTLRITVEGKGTCYRKLVVR